MSKSSTKNILVVDNNPVIIKLMTELLENYGHAVRSAGDVFDCLDMFSQWVPDIIFVDLIMPKIGGEDLCRIIRGRSELKQCYLVIVSAAVLEQKEDMLKYGADEYIAKGPFKEMSGHVLQAVKNCGQRKSGSGHTIKGAEDLHPRQVTRELLEQNDHFRIILNSISQGIIEVDENRIVFVNSRAGMLVGRSREQMLGYDYRHVLPSSLLQVLSAVDDPEEYFPFTVNQPAIRMNERQVVIETFNSPKEGSTIIMLTDVTERKKMESVMEATNLNENLGFIFSGIRHEIGNPINSIKMALSVLQRNLQTYDLETIDDFVSRSLDEVVRIEYLLTALKNYSLFETPITEKLSVSEFINNFMSLVRSDLNQKNIDIEIDVNDRDLTVLADSRALYHVMLNLITNAADAIQDMDAGKVTIEARRNERRVEIRVVDNGKGILPDDQKYLFQPFFTSKAKGTGLGLVNVRKMLVAMNGSVELMSYPGHGTTVSVKLPGAEHA